jgi:hypothetical protein
MYESNRLVDERKVRGGRRTRSDFEKGEVFWTAILEPVGSGISEGFNSTLSWGFWDLGLGSSSRPLWPGAELLLPAKYCVQ